MYQTIRYKKVEGLSFDMFAISLFGYVFLGLSLWAKKDLDYGIMANTIIGITCCVTLMYYILKYRKN
jgi:hypothetical protein